MARAPAASCWSESFEERDICAMTSRRPRGERRGSGFIHAERWLANFCPDAAGVGKLASVVGAARQTRPWYGLVF